MRTYQIAPEFKAKWIRLGYTHAVYAAPGFSTSPNGSIVTKHKSLKAAQQFAAKDNRLSVVVL